MILLTFNIGGDSDDDYGGDGGDGGDGDDGVVVVV